MGSDSDRAVGLGCSEVAYRSARRAQLSPTRSHADRLHRSDTWQQRVLRTLHQQHLLPPRPLGRVPGKLLDSTENMVVAASALLLAEQSSRIPYSERFIVHHTVTQDL